MSEQESKAGQARRGAAGRNKTITVRMHDDEFAAIDAWISAQPDPKPKRPEAIRTLVQVAVNERGCGREMSANKIPSAPQLRAARGLLGISQAQLGHATGLSVGTIRRAEANRKRFGVPTTTLDLIANAFEAVGVQFTYGKAPGVKLRMEPA